MRDYRLSLMVGVDIPVPELQATIHIPTIKDIAYIGEQDFFMAMQYLSLRKEMLIQDETLLSSTTNFQVLMKVLEQSEDKNKLNAIRLLLTCLFPGYTVIIIPPRSITLTVLGEDSKTILIDDDNFEMFQEVIKQVLCVTSLFQRDNIIYDPINDRAKEIADKIMRGRMKIAAMKADEQPGNESVLTRYVSILSVAKIATLDQCREYNMFQLFDQMERYTAQVEWDTDLKIKLQGGKPDKQVESWMRDLHPMK